MKKVPDIYGDEPSGGSRWMSSSPTSMKQGQISLPLILFVFNSISNMTYLILLEVVSHVEGNVDREWLYPVCIASYSFILANGRLHQKHVLY